MKDILERIENYINENIYKDILNKGIIKRILLPKHETGRTESVINELKKKGHNKDEIEKARNIIKNEAEKLAKEMGIKYRYNDNNFHGLGIFINEPIEEFGKELRKRIGRLS